MAQQLYHFSQVTLDIALLWSADAGRDRVLLTSKISIALAIHSLDLLWSETILRRNAFSKPVIERKMSVTC